MRILVAVPEKGFDPTELGVPCKAFLDAGAVLTVASPSGTAPCRADPIMVTGEGLYLLKWSLRADDNGRRAYEHVLSTGLLDTPRSFRSVLDQGIEGYDALLLPGGHCPDMVPYLEDKDLQEIVRRFAATWEHPVDNSTATPTASSMPRKMKVIASVCHGTVVCSRAGILKDRTITLLPKWMENLAFNLTRAFMGTYYKTYPRTSVEEEVTPTCGKYVAGPKSTARDTPTKLFGFVVEDGPLVTARFPGDCHAFAVKALAAIKKHAA
jgi:protease I